MNKQDVSNCVKGFSHARFLHSYLELWTALGKAPVRVHRFDWGDSEGGEDTPTPENQGEHQRPCKSRKAAFGAERGSSEMGDMQPPKGHRAAVNGL